MEEIFIELGKVISEGYIITVILFSYLLIRMWFNSAKTGIKQLLTFIVGIVVGAVYLILKIDALHALIPSYAVAVMLYDYLIKYLLNKLKAGYKVK
jgi:hypothetical protein